MKRNEVAAVLIGGAVGGLAAVGMTLGAVWAWAVRLARRT
jgi:hypothetical protein